jgi:multidrug efflux pump subunit AcrA (membrane-fusion protein)
MKNRKKAGFVIAGAAAITGLVIAGVSIYANAAIKVNSFTVEKNNISQEVELNGCFESELTETLFANSNGLVKKVHVKVGDTVKKGDLLISFDEERIEYLKSLAELEQQCAEQTEAEQNVAQFIERIREYTEIKELNREILNRLIEKIVVSERVPNENGGFSQKIKIYYRFIGDFGEDCFAR